jgi:molybdopterin-guanine dinucleotide biosynthesis protein A
LQVSSALADGVRAVHEFLERLDHVDYVEKGLQRFGAPGLLLMNVNYPEDLERARTSWRDWP